MAQEPNCNESNILPSYSIEKSHVRLFKREAMESMNEEDFRYLLKYSDVVFQKKVCKMRKLNQMRAKEYMFVYASYADDFTAIDKLQEIVQRSGNLLVDVQSNLKQLKTCDYYWRLFSDCGTYSPFKMDRLAMVVEPQVIVEFLRHKSCFEYGPLLDRVQAYLNNRQVEDAACELLRGLPYCSDAVGSERRLGEWYYDFLEALLSHESTMTLPLLIDPNYAKDLQNFRAQDLTEKRVPLICENDFISESDVPPGEPRNQANYLTCYSTSVNFVYKQSRYKLRPYQEELAMHAKQGRNTIICAPTGCGKTIVATDIILNHLRIMRQQKRVARALMLVPTVPLVDQQTVELMRYMASEFRVDGFSGAESLSNRAGSFLAADVCVLTPQLVINMMNTFLKREKIYFSDVTLIVIDECHHCGEQDPYKILMDMLQESGVKRKPQIVGLTASLGVGHTSWDISACREHMLKICTYLLADSISTVRQQLDNLRNHVMPPVDIVLRARRPSNDEFAELIRGAMITIQQRITPALEKIFELQSIPLTKKDISFPNNRYVAKYQNMVGNLAKSLQYLSDARTRSWLMLSIDHLSHYLQSICISDLLPNLYALAYLNSRMCIPKHEENTNKFLIECYNCVWERLHQISRTEKLEDKEILRQLHGILYEQYSEKPESRTLIFVNTRTCAQLLSEYLSDYVRRCESLPIFFGKSNQAGYMTSTNPSVASGGQSVDMQRAMKEKFKRGEIKILVVTSVADEGINIMECNLIIKYNSVGSERALIQRRGRARDKDSRVVLLALDTGVEQQEFDNMKKEAMMLACINDLQLYHDEALCKMIANTAGKLKLLNQNKRDNLAKLREFMSGRRYHLNCRACKIRICDSMDIRSVANSFYVCVDPRIWSRSKTIIFKKQRRDGFTLKCASWTCGTCGEKWGSVVKFCSVFLPCLTVKSFVMETFETNGFISSVSTRKRGWSQIQAEHFNIDPIRPKDIVSLIPDPLKKLKSLKKMTRQWSDKKLFLIKCCWVECGIGLKKPPQHEITLA